MEMLKYEPYKVALVALDLTKMDDHLIAYTAMISKILPLERIFFVHVAKTLELPDQLLKEYPDLLEPLDESIEKDIQSKIDEHFSSSELAVDCIVKEGNSIEKILKLCRIKGVDLLIMGRKPSLQGSGLVSSKIARKCPCSLLLVTEEYSQDIKSILVPLDFSEHSSLAMRRALDISEKTQALLLLMHVYGVPKGFYKTGKSYKEFAEIVKKHAQNDCKRFLASNDFPSDLSCEYVLTEDGKHPELTYALAERTNADMIVIGSRGRTNISAVLMGSVAEKLVYLDSNIPILIVKNDGENMGFLDALMKI